MAKRIRSTGAFFLQTSQGAETSGSFGAWGSLSHSRGNKTTFIRSTSRPLGNPNPKHRFTSTNQPPRP